MRPAAAARFRAAPGYPAAAGRLSTGAQPYGARVVTFRALPGRLRQSGRSVIRLGARLIDGFGVGIVAICCRCCSDRQQPLLRGRCSGLATFAYFALFESQMGRTPGKMLLVGPIAPAAPPSRRCNRPRPAMRSCC